MSSSQTPKKYGEKGHQRRKNVLKRAAKGMHCGADASLMDKKTGRVRPEVRGKKERRRFKILVRRGGRPGVTGPLGDKRTSPLEGLKAKSRALAQRHQTVSELAGGWGSSIEGC